jgi:hypothetical protein
MSNQTIRTDTMSQVLDLALSHQSSIQAGILRAEDLLQEALENENRYVDVELELQAVARRVVAWRDLTRALVGFTDQDSYKHRTLYQVHALEGYVDALLDIAALRKQLRGAIKLTLGQFKRAFHYAEDEFQRDFRIALDASLDA